MQLSIPHSALVTDLQTATRAASTHTALQSLSGVQIHASDDGGAELRATDMDVGVRLTLDADVVRPGEVVLPARLLLDVVRALPGPEVRLTLRADQQDVEITSGAAAFFLRTLRNDDFPRLPPTPGADAVSLDASAFADTVTRVARAASRDETRPVLTGILVSATEHDLRMVATDSYRLSVTTTTLETPIATPLEANVPARALTEVVRIAQQSGTSAIAISRTDNQIAFAVDRAVLSSRLIDGEFPNYRLLLPETADHELRVDREELAGVVRRVSLLAQKNAPVRLGFSDGELLVSAQTPDVGEAREALPIPFAGEPLDIGFNADFLRDGLESVTSREVVLKLTTPLRPGLIEAGDGGEFVYLVMPIRLPA